MYSMFLSKLIAGVPDTISSLRSTLEPLLIFHEIGPYAGIQEEEFRGRTLYWRDESIDSILYGLAILDELDKEELGELIDNHHEEIVCFLIDNFANREDGLAAFRQSGEAQPTVYASSMAMSVVKYISGVPQFGEALGYDRATETLGPRGPEFVEKTVEFTLRAQDPNTGGFFDSPPSTFKQRASLTTTHSACYLLWNLDRLEVAREGIRNFIFSCLKEADATGRAIGFADYPTGSPLTCATYYALRVLERLEENRWIKGNRGRITAFLKSCWREKDGTGAFSASPGTSRTLAHTCYAVQILLDILKDSTFLLEAQRIEKLLPYIKACRSRYGGFRFGTWRRWYSLGHDGFSPNLYMTRHVIRTVKLLEGNHRGSVDVLQEDKINSFVDSASRPMNAAIPSGYTIEHLGMGGVVVRLFRRLVDSLLMPRNPLKHPPITMTPIPYYLVTIFFIVAFLLLWISGALRSDVALGSMAGPIALEIIAIMGIVRWFMTR